MNDFKRVNLILGWTVFFLSALVYFLTMEPSASLWDCSEFIATSYKMEIGHPPGAPLFMMINRFFSMFASDVTNVAMMVNSVSVLASAFTIMFLYWTIAHLALKLIDKTRETATVKDSLLVYGSAFIGAMSYAFTDTFWFSAVEGEVYAQSSLFTAMVFWAMFKWENESDKASSSRWLILIAYLMGLSIGVHLLNLLSIPALVMIYYYKKYPNRSRAGWWKAFGLSIVLLASVLFVIIPKTVELGASVDRLFVNGMGFGKNIGFTVFVILLLGLIAFGVYYTNKHKKVVLNTIILCIGVLMIGYGTYASVIIRASANLPMNSNHPDDPYSLLSVLNREQYGKTPLLYGPYYSAKPIPFVKDDNIIMYESEKKYYYDENEKIYKYELVRDDATLQYMDGTFTLFPRLHHESYGAQYANWVDIDGTEVSCNIPLETSEGTYVHKDTNIIPSFGDNLAYFFNYQVNYMYWRYFLWNFVGRQNDTQGEGGIMAGNWISGIDFIDELYLGPQSNLPDQLENAHSRNTYFFLPFLLGIAGLVYQLSRKRGDFIVVSFLFLMTGLAIILYLNQTPDQARERDYAYAGSFYAFSIWIGLGVFWLYSLINKVVKAAKPASIIAIALAMSVPVILITQNWDDHDRSGRYLGSDFGKNYLSSTLPNSIILPYGDNDTFGPWYAQEVEGHRTDVRICNLSYIQSNWYASQMLSKFNDSAPIALTIPERVFSMEINNAMDIVELQEGYVDIMTVLNFIKIQSPKKSALLEQGGYRDGEEFFPAKKIAIPVNKSNALKAGIITEKNLHRVVDTIFIDLNKNRLTRPEYLLLDMIATSDWSRPVYFTQTSHTVGELGLADYLQYDGFGYRLVPIKSEGEDIISKGIIDTEYLYNKLMNEYKYGNTSDPDVMMDTFTTSYIRSSQSRNAFSRLAMALVDEGQKERGSEVILRGLEEIPISQIGHDYYSANLIKALHLTGNENKAEEVLNDAIYHYMSYIDYYSQFIESLRFNVDGEINEVLLNLHWIYDSISPYGYEEQMEIILPFVSMN